MDPIVIIVALAIVGGIAYLIGHTHGAKTTPPLTVIVPAGSGTGTGPVGPGSGTAQPGNNPQIKADAS